MNQLHTYTYKSQIIIFTILLSFCWINSISSQPSPYISSESLYNLKNFFTIHFFTILQSASISKFLHVFTVCSQFLQIAFTIHQLILFSFSTISEFLLGVFNFFVTYVDLTHNLFAIHFITFSSQLV